MTKKLIFHILSKSSQTILVLTFYLYLFGFFSQKRGIGFSVKRYSKLFSNSYISFGYKIIKYFIKKAKLFGHKTFGKVNFYYINYYVKGIFNFLFPYFYFSEFILYENIIFYFFILFFLINKIITTQISFYIKFFILSLKYKEYKKKINENLKQQIELKKKETRLKIPLVVRFLNTFVKNRSWIKGLSRKKYIFKLLGIEHLFLYYVTISSLFLVVYYKYLTIVVPFLFPYVPIFLLNKILVYFNILFFLYSICSIIYILKKKYIALPFFTEAAYYYIGKELNNKKLYSQNKRI